MGDAKRILLTTAPGVDGHRVERVVDVISAECAFGMNIFRDLFAGVRDVFGGRSGSVQNALRDARVKCLGELRAEAAAAGANAVIAVDLDYSEFSGQGKSMLFLVATGTAVVLDPPPGGAHSGENSPEPGAKQPPKPSTPSTRPLPDSWNNPRDWADY